MDSITESQADTLVWLDCACCGRGFRGWQHWGRDDGYGICDDADCATAYGYHTVGPRPSGEGYKELCAKIAKEKI